MIIGWLIIAMLFITKSTHCVSGTTVDMKPEDRGQKSDDGLVRE
jgi:hypothetical protein